VEQNPENQLIPEKIPTEEPTAVVEKNVTEEPVPRPISNSGENQTVKVDSSIGKDVAAEVLSLPKPSEAQDPVPAIEQSQHKEIKYDDDPIVNEIVADCVAEFGPECLVKDPQPLETIEQSRVDTVVNPSMDISPPIIEPVSTISAAKETQIDHTAHIDSEAHADQEDQVYNESHSDTSAKNPIPIQDETTETKAESTDAAKDNEDRGAGPTEQKPDLVTSSNIAHQPSTPMPGFKIFKKTNKKAQHASVSPGSSKESQNSPTDSSAEMTEETSPATDSDTLQLLHEVEATPSRPTNLGMTSNDFLSADVLKPTLSSIIHIEIETALNRLINPTIESKIESSIQTKLDSIIEAKVNCRVH
jgi:hypothetical protein